MPDASMRARNLELLNSLGFRVADTLPTLREETTGLRPKEEIAARLFALDAVFTWASFFGQQTPSERITGYIERNALDTQLTNEERAILALDRETARARHGNAIGWLLENMWPLAWILGFEMRPEVDGGMIEDPVIKGLYDFLPKLDGAIGPWLEGKVVRTEAEVLPLEDLFYCAHNAVRSAQLGGKTVPEGFHPVADGGVVHERRHALTWATSPGVLWDDTDLST